jgi:hypothetical protein
MQSFPVISIGLIMTSSGVVVTHEVIVAWADGIVIPSGLLVVQIFFDSVIGIMVTTSG